MNETDDRDDAYVVGFAFIGFSPAVVLIEKKRPDWQAGQLNGVGGHMKWGESCFEAMAREFREETGVITRPERWKTAEVQQFSNGVKLFVMTMNLFSKTQPATRTDERVAVYHVPWVLSIEPHPVLDIQAKIRHCADVLRGAAVPKTAKIEI